MKAIVWRPWLVVVHHGLLGLMWPLVVEQPHQFCEWLLMAWALVVDHPVVLKCLEAPVLVRVIRGRWGSPRAALLVRMLARACSLVRMGCLCTPGLVFLAEIVVQM